MSSKAPAATLLTFAPMIDSECTRLILLHYGIPFDERDHIFGWASLLTFVHGGYGRVPLLYKPGLRCSGPRKTVDKLDAGMADRRLLPAEEPARAAVERDWAIYNGQLAAHVAVVAYYHLLPARDAMTASLQRPLAGLERRLVAPTYPALSLLFRVLLRLNADHVAKASALMEGVLDHADQSLADGRRFLQGDKLTLGDFGLVSALAPLLLPPRYERHVPPLDSVPATFRDIVQQVRQRPVAPYAHRVIEAVEGQEK